MPESNPATSHIVVLLPGFTPMGAKEQIAIPGHYNVPAKETMVITTTLPENYTQSSLAIRSSLQDIRFYIDGVLRTEYSTKDHRLTGKNSPAVMFSVLLQQQMQERTPY